MFHKGLRPMCLSLIKAALKMRWSEIKASIVSRKSAHEDAFLKKTTLAKEESHGGCSAALQSILLNVWIMDVKVFLKRSVQLWVPKGSSRWRCSAQNVAQLAAGQNLELAPNVTCSTKPSSAQVTPSHFYRFSFLVWLHSSVPFFKRIEPMKKQTHFQNIKTWKK